MGSLFTKKKDVTDVDISTSFYFYNTYDLIVPFYFKETDFKNLKTDFTRDFIGWDDNFENWINESMTENVQFKFLKQNETNPIKLKYRDGYYFIKNLTDLAWVDVNWDLFTQDDLNYNISFEFIAAMYCKINGITYPLNIADSKEYKKLCDEYRILKINDEMNKINSYVIN
jgi:hypothetical protein